MRVADYVQDCAVFIGKVNNGRFTPLGTAFFVGYPFKDGAFQYLVTALHIVATETDLKLRINRRGGNAETFDLPSDK
jgi:hypothetical protein